MREKIEKRIPLDHHSLLSLGRPCVSKDNSKEGCVISFSEMISSQLFTEKQKKTGLGPKLSVFSRLGNEVTSTAKSGSEPTVTITGLGNISLPPSAAAQVCVYIIILSRLGNKVTSATKPNHYCRTRKHLPLSAAAQVCVYIIIPM